MTNVNCTDCKNCVGCKNCADCGDCAYCENCTNCTNLFQCVGLVNHEELFIDPVKESNNPRFTEVIAVLATVDMHTWVTNVGAREYLGMVVVVPKETPQ